MRRTKAQLNQIGEALAALEGAFAARGNRMGRGLRLSHAVAEAAGNELFPRLLEELRDILSGSMRMALGLTRQGSDDRAAVSSKNTARSTPPFRARTGISPALHALPSDGIARPYHRAPMAISDPVMLRSTSSARR